MQCWLRTQFSSSMRTLAITLHNPLGAANSTSYRHCMCAWQAVSCATYAQPRTCLITADISMRTEHNSSFGSINPAHKHGCLIRAQRVLSHNILSFRKARSHLGKQRYSATSEKALKLTRTHQLVRPFVITTCPKSDDF